MMGTERLVIRPFRAGDARDLYEYLSDEEVVRFEPYTAFTEEQAAKEAARRAGDPRFWGVCLKEGGKLIGNIYFARQEPKEFMEYELGYVFNRAYGGRGYATEAAKRLLQYGFEECGAHRITACCSPLNTKSWRLLERLAMRREGHFREKVFFFRDAEGKPLWHDAYEYAMLDAEWNMG